MLGRKKDDDIGISILDKRLNNEKLDDNVIDDLLTSDKEKKNAKKEMAKADVLSGNVSNNETDENNTKSQKADKKVPNKNSGNPMENTGIHSDTGEVNSVSEKNVEHTEQVQPMQVQENNSQPIMQQKTKEQVVQPVTQQAETPISSVKDTAEPQVKRNVVDVTGESRSEEDIIQDVISNTYNLFSDNTSNKQVVNNNPVPQSQPIVQPIVYVTPPQPMLVQPQAYVTPQIQPQVQSQSVTAPLQQETQTESNPSTPVYRKRKKRPLPVKIGLKLLTYATYIAITCAFIWVVTTYIIGFTDMNGASMEPTYYNKETLVVDKISINFNDPKTDDVIVFKKDKVEYVARIVGVPGDKIAIDVDGRLIVNDKYWVEYNEKSNKSPLVSDTDKDDKTVLAEKVSEFVLNKNEFYVISDNTEAPIDSRDELIGTVSKNDIYGIVLLSFNFNKD